MIFEIEDPQVRDAFKNPENYDWSEPDKIESALYRALKTDQIVFGWSLADRRRAEAIINTNKREAVEFSGVPGYLGNLRIRVVKP